MAPRLYQHEYPLAPMIWSELEHFRVSGSTPTGQLLCSFTEAIRVASPFESETSQLVGLRESSMTGFRFP